MGNLFCRDIESVEDQNKNPNPVVHEGGNNGPNKGGASAADAAGEKVDPFLNDQEMQQYRIRGKVLLIRNMSKEATFDVYMGHFQGQPVTIKQLPEGGKTIDQAQLLITEIKKMGKLDHPKIIRFIGASWNTRDDLCAITEHMDNGDLRGFLDRNGADKSWKERKLGIAIDVAEALDYLHSLHPIVLHRDLKSKNILLNSKWVAKLGNFGSSGSLDFEKTITSGVGTLRWASPEVLMEQEDYNQSADVFSFGILLSELQTGKVPYSHLSAQDETKLSMGIITGTIYPEFGDNCPPSILKLAKACLQLEPRNRPSATRILEMLNNEVFVEVNAENM